MACQGNGFQLFISSVAAPADLTPCPHLLLLPGLPAVIMFCWAVAKTFQPAPVHDTVTPDHLLGVSNLCGNLIQAKGVGQNKSGLSDLWSPNWLKPHQLLVLYIHPLNTRANLITCDFSWTFNVPG